MDREKYPNYLLLTIMAYFLAFIFGFSFFLVPALGFGFGYSEFYLIAILFFLPMILLAVYYNMSRFELLWGKERIMRYAIVAATAIDLFFAVYLGLWLL